MPVEHKKSYSLLCPGPVNVSPRVKKAMTAYEIGHREIEFSELLNEIRKNILTVAQVDPEQYSAVIITGSGSAANEAVLSSAIQAGERVLSLSNGEFGRRLGDIASIYHPQLLRQEQDWATALDLIRLEESLKTQNIQWVTMVHHETSTGELQPVEEVGKLCAKYGAKLMVDAVSSFMADKLDLAAANVSFMTSSSGKALGMPPGLAIVIGKKSEFQALCNYPPKNYYLNLARHFEYHETCAQTPNTPAISLFLALNEALLQVMEESPEARFATQTAKAKYLREGLHNIGLELINPMAKLSNAVSSVLLPEGIDFEKLRHLLREQSFVIYCGKGPLLNKIVQISTMGHITNELIDEFLQTLYSALQTLSAQKLHIIAIAPPNCNEQEMTANVGFAQRRAQIIAT